MNIRNHWNLGAEFVYSTKEQGKFTFVICFIKIALFNSSSVMIDQNKKLQQSCYSWVKFVNFPRVAAGKQLRAAAGSGNS